MINFTAPIKPVPFMRVQTNGTRRFNDRRYSKFKADLGWYARQAMTGQEPLNGLLRLSCHFYKKFRSVGSPNYGDVDNFAKAVMDALQGICYTNDAQITELHSYKHYGEPLIKITLEELQNGQTLEIQTHLLA